MLPTEAVSGDQSWSSPGWHLTLCKVPHPLQCILHPAVLSSSGLDGCSQPGLALSFSSFFVCFWGFLFFFLFDFGLFVCFFPPLFETCILAGLELLISLLLPPTNWYIGCTLASALYHAGD